MCGTCDDDPSTCGWTGTNAAHQVNLLMTLAPLALLSTPRDTMLLATLVLFALLALLAGADNREPNGVEVLGQASGHFRRVASRRCSECCATQRFVEVKCVEHGVQ